MGQAVAAPVEVEGLDDPEVLGRMAQGMVLGDPDAPLTIFEFGDYQCPACGMFALQVKPLIEQAYVADGTANFVYYDFPLGGQAGHRHGTVTLMNPVSERDSQWKPRPWLGIAMRDVPESLRDR